MDGDDAIRIRLAYSFVWEGDVLEGSVSGVGDRVDLTESEITGLEARNNSS